MGDTFNAVALVILVYRLTGSGVKVAGTVAFEIAPVMLLGFVAGAVVDRYSRRRVMVAADLGRAAVAILLVTSHDQLAVVYLAAFALSAFSVFFNPAAASVLPTLVPGDEVVGANSAIWSAAVISQIALAPVAAALVAIAGPGPAFAVNSISFLVSAALLVRLPIATSAVTASGKHLRDVAEGLRAITASRFLTVLACVQGLAALSAGATSALLVVLAEEHLDVGPARFGLLIAAIGIGAGFGPLVLHRVVDDVRRPSFLYGALPPARRGRYGARRLVALRLRPRRAHLLWRRHEHRQRHLQLGAADDGAGSSPRQSLRVLRRRLADSAPGEHRHRRCRRRPARHHRRVLGSRRAAPRRRDARPPRRPGTHLVRSWCRPGSVALSGPGSRRPR